MPKSKAPRKPQTPPAPTMVMAERRPPEDILRESEQRFRALVESTPVGVVMSDGDGRMLLVNAMTEELFGYRREELLGRPVEMLLPERLRDAHAGHRAGYFSAPDVRPMGLGLDRVGRRKDGTELPIDCGLSFVESKSGVLAITFITDLTDRKRAEEALRESEERFRLLAEHAQDVIFRYRLTEPQGYEYISPAVAAVAGYPPEQFYADPDFTFKIVHPDDREAFERMLGERRTGPVVFRWIRKDGEVIWTEQRNTIVYNDAGDLVAIEGVARDITKRKRAEEALRRAREELEGRVERQMLHRNPYGLTFREFTVLHLVAAGRADKEIACELGISPLTVHKHVGNILAKMSAASRTEAGVRALREGLLD